MFLEHVLAICFFSHVRWIQAQLSAQRKRSSELFCIYIRTSKSELEDCGKSDFGAICKCLQDEINLDYLLT